MSSTIEDFGRGLKDSFNVFKFLLNVTKEEKRMHKSKSKQNVTQENEKDEPPNIVGRVWKCVATNFLLSVFPILLFMFVLCPVIKIMIKTMHSEEWAQYLWGWTETLLTRTFHMFWVYPLFILLRIVNLNWYQDIADSLFMMRNGRPKKMGYGIVVADLTINFFAQLMIIIQCWVLNLNHFLNPLYHMHPCVLQTVTAVHYAMLYSLYGFEYKWFNMGLKLDRRIRIIEEHWPYYLGFGLPFYIVTDFFADPFIKSGLFAVLFPLFILSSQEASPRHNKCDVSLKLFTPSIYFVMRCFARNTRFSPSLRATSTSHTSSKESIPAATHDISRSSSRTSTPRMTPPPISSTPDHTRHRIEHRRRAFME